MTAPPRALVLAAGLGRRLAPLTDRVPKPLVPVGGRPLIAYALAWLAGWGVEEVAVNLHHLGEQVRAWLGDGTRLGLRVRYSQEDTLLDTGGAIRALGSFFEDGPFVVVNSDVVQDVDLADLLDRHRRQRALATLVLRPDPESARYGEIGVDRAGRVRSFLDAGATADASLARLMFTGVHVLDPAILPRIPWPGASSITRDVYRPLVAAGEALTGVRYEGFWADAGTPESLAALDAALAPGGVELRYAPLLAGG